ncbi:hypothetical protein OH76DRAFT_1482460 [Lentinus brumalis]|uniref:Methyltransferase domain-containing protein n=1 Tax=Lentinus brumalis TaxID=2498619 RepID=A0A371DCP5_9APHY|nr:hypothetical protein OH76DRAFT_1482460 [Polyporus brumalis]
MIVRPTAGALPGERTRAQPTTRRRANSTGSALIKEAQAVVSHIQSTSPSSPSSRIHPSPLAISPKQSGALAEPLLRSLSGKRRLFRLKRPSSSSGDTRAARDRASNAVVQTHGSLGTVAVVSPPGSPLVPPRPPRNPARTNLAPSPSKPSGIPARASHLHTAADSRELDAAADWEFPLPRGSEFPLQRKKSKSSRFNTSRIMQDESAKSDVPFSTVDRTILEELGQKMRAREAQFVIRSGRKYHAFPADEVPYPRSYDRQMVDMDVWDDLWHLQLGGSITMHVFDTPPTRVLDLGCGTGTWILTAAREWKDTCFVGVDVVPLHPDLLQVGCWDLASRITWVQANFLERLPFPNEEFDYVRLVRVSRGVPEDKWDAFLEEITRVMRPGGAFEMWEEDLHFPGARRESVSIIESPDPMQPPTPPRTDSSHSSEQDRTLPPGAFALPLHRAKAFSYSFDDVTKVMRPLVEDTRPPLHAMPPTTHAPPTPMLLRNLDRPPMNPHDHSLLETIYAEMHSARFINLEPVSILANMLPLHFKDVRAPPPIVITFPPPPVVPAFDASSSSIALDKHSAVMTDSDSDDHSHSTETTAPGSFTFPTPKVLHARDMEAGSTPFVGLDTSRYSGLSPAAARRSSDAAVHVSRSPAPPLHRDAPLPLTHLANPRLVAGRNPLPNQTVNFDPRSLNLLLTLRVAEVLGCAEPMWDWVVDFQESVARSAQSGGVPRVSEHLTWRPPRRRRHPQHDALMSLTRQEFDALMRRFELDMKNRMYLDAAVEDRLGWAPHTAGTTEERETFDAMCAAWDAYQQRQAAGETIRGRLYPQRNSSPAPPHARASDGDADATLRARDDRRAYHAHSHVAPSLPGEVDKLPRRKSAPTRNPRRPSTANADIPPPLPTPPPSIQSSRLSSSLCEPEPESPPTSRTGRIFVAWKA